MRLQPLCKVSNFNCEWSFNMLPKCVNKFLVLPYLSVIMILQRAFSSNHILNLTYTLYPKTRTHRKTNFTSLTFICYNSSSLLRLFVNSSMFLACCVLVYVPLFLQIRLCSSVCCKIFSVILTDIKLHPQILKFTSMFLISTSKCIPNIHFQLFYLYTTKLFNRKLQGWLRILNTSYFIGHCVTCPLRIH